MVTIIQSGFNDISEIGMFQNVKGLSTGIRFTGKLSYKILKVFGSFFISFIFLFQLLLKRGLFSLSPGNKLFSLFNFVMHNFEFGLGIRNVVLVLQDGLLVLSLLLVISFHSIFLSMSPFSFLTGQVVDILVEQINDLSDFSMVNFLSISSQLGESKSHLKFCSLTVFQQFFSLF